MTRVEDGSHESVEKSVAAFVLLAAKARLSQRVPQAVAPHHGLQDRLPSKCLHPIIGCWALKNLEILCVSLFYELLVNLFCFFCCCCCYLGILCLILKSWYRGKLL